MDDLYSYLIPTLITLFIICQALYSLTFIIDLYLFTLPINWVDMSGLDEITKKGDYPFIVMFYPVLREPEATMRTTFLSLGQLDYPKDRYRILAIPNSDDEPTIQSLKRLQKEFDFVKILETPPTSHPSWQTVWDHWDKNPKAYWWHEGAYAYNRDLPPKKTRQIIYSFYTVADEILKKQDFLLSYIDADSCPPTDHFLAAAVGMRQYDVLQATNVAGNLNTSMAATWHAMDHMAWDGLKYPHLSANGKQPYWMLGKGLIFKASDLIELAGFHPWVTIEDPEVGMRLWINGKRLGIIANPLIEEVPEKIRQGFLQRKRWTCGFFQSLGEPLTRMGFTRKEKIKAWLNFMPCLMLSLNSVGIPIGIWALWTYLNDTSVLPEWTIWISALNICAFAVSLGFFYYRTWKRTALVLDKLSSRIWFMIRINPISAMLWWLIWIIPIVLGFRMFLGEGGLVWERTEKIDANADLIRLQFDPARAKR